MGVQSPCIGICRLQARSGLCEGCLRTVEEIKAWGSMPDDERCKVVRLIEQRQAQLVNFE